METIKEETRKQRTQSSFDLIFSFGALRSSITNGTTCHSSQFLGLYLIKYLKEISNMSFELIIMTISPLIDDKFPIPEDRIKSIRFKWV